MRARQITAATLAALMLTACGGGDEKDEGLEPARSTEQTATTAPTTTQPDPGEPGDALREFVEMTLAGQFGRAWERLHPEHQRLVSKARYELCQREHSISLPATELREFDVEETYAEEVTLPGTDVTAQSTAVTWRASLRGGGEIEEVRDTSHLYNVNGEWRLALADLTEYDEDC